MALFVYSEQWAGNSTKKCIVWFSTRPYRNRIEIFLLKQIYYYLLFILLLEQTIQWKQFLKNYNKIFEK